MGETPSTEVELMKKLEQIYEEIAKKHGTSTEKVRRDIRSALKAGERNPDPAVRAVWTEIPHSGDKPTPKEVIAFCAEECRRRLLSEESEGPHQP